MKRFNIIKRTGFCLFLSLLLFISSCATVPTPTIAETYLRNKGNMETPASRKELLDINDGLKQKIYELDKKETLARIAGWSFLASFVFNTIVILTTASVAAANHK